MIPLSANNKPLKKYILLALAISSINITQAQVTKDELLGQRNVITTAAPFLLISPDSRGASMGDMGVATSADANSIHWNPSKLAFIEDDAGIAISAAPWLRQLVPDIWFYYMSGYKRIDKKSTVAGSLRYFTLGEIQFTDEIGTPQGVAEPVEFAVDGAYARKLSDNLSLGIALRFIYSNLARGNTGISAAEIKAGLAGAGDLSMTYKNDIKISNKDFE
jgi:hypothetical protein